MTVTQKLKNMKTNRRIFNKSIASLVAALITPSGILTPQDNIIDISVPIQFPFFQNSDGCLSISLISTFELETTFVYGELEPFTLDNNPDIDINLTFYLDETKTIDRTLTLKTNKIPIYTNISEDFKKKRQEKIWYTSAGFNLFKNKPLNPVDVVVNDIFEVEIFMESDSGGLSTILLNDCKVIEINDYRDGVLCLDG